MPDATSLPRTSGTDDPLVTFQGRTPYDDYVHASVLSSLQQPLTDAPHEMAFLVTTQVMELWFTLTVHEWRTARDALVKDDHERAMGALRRSISAHHALNDSLQPIAKMTPAQFNGFREAFGAASGFQSAKYREMEFLLGDRSRSLMNPQRDDLRAYAELEELLYQPSLYDETLFYLHRRGLPVPEHVLERDVSAPYEADPDIEEVWRRIYAGPQNDPLLDLGEALTDIADAVMRWRGDHLLATRRAMGSKAGSGGSSGVAWLEKRAARPLFPEIWTARGHV
nr:tryptophan 2,3-dioxygenase family protein [Streptomyces canus]